MKFADYGRLITGKTFWLEIKRLIISKLLVMANSGGGKSWAIRKLVEIIYGHTQIIILDAEGEFGTLRERMDFILAGPDGDIQADPRYAEALARKVLELRSNLIVDLYELDKAKKVQFVALFLDAMTNAPKKLWHDVVLILDEAHGFAPEKGKAESLKAVQDFASKGRKRGFCLVLATQRLAKLNKDVAAECQNKLLGLANWKIDRQRAADELGLSEKDEIMTLRDMKPGDFYAVGPAFPRDVNRVKIGQVRTTHHEAGSQGHGRHRKPAPTAKIKAVLAKLVDIPKEVQQEANDVMGLRSQVHQLEAALRQAKAVQASPLAPGLPKVADRLIREAVDRERNQINGRLQDAHERGRQQAVALVESMAADKNKQLSERAKKFRAAIDEAAKVVDRMFEIAKANPTFKHLKVPTLTYEAVGKAGKLMPLKPSKPEIQKHFVSMSDDEKQLGKAERSILAFLNLKPGIMFPVRTVGPMSGYRPGGTLNNALGRLKALGYIDRQSGQVALKPGVVVSHLVEGFAHTLDQWINRLGRREAMIYKLVKDAPDARFTIPNVCELLGFELGGTTNNALGRLKTLGLIKRENGVIQFNNDLLL